MANVFGGGNSTSPSCGDSGINRVLPTSPEALRSTQTQTFSTGPNVYSKSAPTAENLNLRDYYTKADVQRLLKTKADISSVYTEAEVDAALSALSQSINATLVEFVTDAEVDEKVSASQDGIFSYLSQNYYAAAQLYTKSEIDSLLGTLELGTDFVRKEPTTTAQNTISPGGNGAVPLTLRASSNPDITTIQHWIDAQSNSVGRVRTSGRVEFYGHMVLGQNIEAWRPALDANIRRISGVADPIHTLDAVNKKYMEDYIVEVVDDIQRGDNLVFDIDCLTY